MKKINVVFIVLGVLTLSALLDIAHFRMKQIDSISFQPPISLLFGLQIVGTILITVLLLFISWYLLCYSSYDSTISIVCVLLGAVILFLVTIPGTHFVAQFNLSRNMLRIWQSDIVSSNLSLTSHSAAFIFCIGVIRLWPDKYIAKLRS